MGNDFFSELGETITKTAKGISEKADVFFETQKLQNKAVSERRLIEKNLSDMGNLIYRRFVDGEELDEELTAICERIHQHQTVIAGYKEEMARLKGCKICGCCGETIDRDSSYCPKCGAPCGDMEPEPVKVTPEEAVAPEEAFEEEPVCEPAESTEEPVCEPTESAEEPVCEPAEEEIETEKAEELTESADK